MPYPNEHDGISFEPASDENKLQETMELRAIPIELRVGAGEDNAPVIEGRAAVYNRWTDLGYFREMIEPGFFESVLKDDVRALWNHNADLVLGRTKNKSLVLDDDERGLNVQIRPADTQTGRDAVTSIKRGDVDQMSFAFMVKEGGDEWKRDKNGITRVLKRGGCERLFDVSPVTYPAYPQTSVHVRSKLDELLTVELLEESAEASERTRAQARRNLRKRKLELTRLRVKEK